MKTRLTKKIFRTCTFSDKPNSVDTLVLDLTFKQWDERVQTQVKDIQDQDNKKYIKIVIETCRIEADKHFKNKIAEKVMLATNVN